MIGAYKIRVKNSKNTYTFELRRNISILCGDSGRGKTNLYEMMLIKLTGRSDYKKYAKDKSDKMWMSGFDKEN